MGNCHLDRLWCTVIVEQTVGKDQLITFRHATESLGGKHKIQDIVRLEAGHDIGKKLVGELLDGAHSGIVGRHCDDDEGMKNVS